MANKNCHISNSTSHLDTILDRVDTTDMGLSLKELHPISKKFLPFIHFFFPAMYLSSIQISTIHTYVLFAIFSSSVETKKEIVISNFLLLNPVKFTDS